MSFLQRGGKKNEEELFMEKNDKWSYGVTVTVTAMPGLGLTMVQAEEKKTLKVAMECGYAPYNWTQPDDSNGAVPISGSSDYAYGYDVMMAKKSVTSWDTIWKS